MSSLFMHARILSLAQITAEGFALLNKHCARVYHSWGSVFESKERCRAWRRAGHGLACVAFTDISQH